MTMALATNLVKGAGVLAGSALAAAGGWWVYSRLGIDHDLYLPPALDAARRDFVGAAGRSSYYSEAQAAGRPLVLVHSVNAAASAFEVKPLFERYRGRRPVYALELPGYGFSERARRSYTPELFATALREFLATHIDEPADVVALSLSSEFAARAALAAPERFNTLAFISPTGMNTKREARASVKAGEQGGNDTFYRVASNPLWAKAFYDLIATQTSIHYFLQQSFVGEVPPDLAAYAYLTSHQPGAEHVPLHFISGKLFTPRARERLYKHLPMPTLVLFDEDAFVSFEKLPALLASNTNVQAVRLEPSRGLPHFDLPERTVAALDAFWQAV
ncbi:alpha/beta fold hydrolase [soil metagenome]